MPRAGRCLDALPPSPSPDGSGWGPLWDEARAAAASQARVADRDAARRPCPSDVPVFTDACEIGYRMQADWPSHGPRRFFYPSNYITLGWAFPAAVGAAVALGDRPVVSVSGDGGFVMTAQELATAARYRLRVIAMVHNDSTYGAIKNIQDRAHEGRYLDTELNNPDFLRLAAAYGVPGRQARSPEELAAAVREALDRDGPSLIEVPDRWRFLRDLATPVRPRSQVRRREGGGLRRLDRAMDSNPIFRFELIRTARQRRHYAMRVVLGLLLLYVAWMLYAFWDQSAAMAGGRERSRIIRHLPRVADLVVLQLVWSQGVAILLVVPGLVAGSIAEEDRRGTMLALLASPMSSGSIVLGKLAARLAIVGVAVAIGLPVVVPLALLGALDPAVVALAYAMLIALALFVGSLSLLVSAVVRTARPAMLWSYIVVGSWLLLPAWFAPLAGRAGWPFSWLQALADGDPPEPPARGRQVPVAGPGGRDLLPAGRRMGVVGRLEDLAARRRDPARLLDGLPRPGFAAPPPPAIWKRRGREAASRPLRRDRPSATTRCSGRNGTPTRSLSRRAAGMAIALFVVLVVCPLIEPATASFREWHASWWDDAAGRLGTRLAEPVPAQLDAGLYLIGLAAVAAMAATSVTGERERGTWTSLAMTLRQRPGGRSRQGLRRRSGPCAGWRSPSRSCGGSAWRPAPSTRSASWPRRSGSSSSPGTGRHSASSARCLPGPRAGRSSATSIALLASNAIGADVRTHGPHRLARRDVADRVPGRRVAVRRVDLAGLSRGDPLVPGGSNLGRSDRATGWPLGPGSPSIPA